MPRQILLPHQTPRARSGSASTRSGAGIARGKIRVERDSANRRVVPASEVEWLRGPVAERPPPLLEIASVGLFARVEIDGFLARVEIDVTEPSRIVAIVTREAIEELSLKPGMSAAGVVKSTSVMVER